MELQFLSPGQHFERNTASGGSSQHMGNSGNTSSNSSHRVINRDEHPSASPHDSHRRVSSPDGSNCGRSPGQQFDHTTATGASNQQLGNTNSHNNHSVTNYFQRSPARTAIISVIVAIIIILSVALSVTLTENARSSEEKSTEAQRSSSLLPLSSASPSQTSSIAPTTTSPNTWSTTGSSGTSPTATPSRSASAGDIRTTVSVPTDDARYSTFIPWICDWGCPGKPCSVDEDCGKKEIASLTYSSEIGCDFGEGTCSWI